MFGYRLDAGNVRRGFGMTRLFSNNIESVAESAPTCHIVSRRRLESRYLDRSAHRFHFYFICRINARDRKESNHQRHADATIDRSGNDDVVPLRPNPLTFERQPSIVSCTPFWVAQDSICSDGPPEPKRRIRFARMVVRVV